jgi:hypothetical protein
VTAPTQELLALNRPPTSSRQPSSTGFEFEFETLQERFGDMYMDYDGTSTWIACWRIYEIVFKVGGIVKREEDGLAAALPGVRTRWDDSLSI